MRTKKVSFQTGGGQLIARMKLPCRISHSPYRQYSRGSFRPRRFLEVWAGKEPNRYTSRLSRHRLLARGLPVSESTSSKGPHLVAELPIRCKPTSRSEIRYSVLVELLNDPAIAETCISQLQHKDLVELSRCPRGTEHDMAPTTKGVLLLQIPKVSRSAPRSCHSPARR